MEFNVTERGSKMLIQVEGWLDTKTAPELDNFVNTSLSGVTALMFDLSQLSYISSAGLRVLLSAQKIMNKQGSMTVVGCSDEIMEIFEITGFTDILTIE